MSSWGAYGYRLPDLDGAAGLTAVDDDAPVIRVDVRLLGGDEAADAHADKEIPLVDSGLLSLDWPTRRAVLRLPVLPPRDELLHPWLAPVVAEFARRDGAVVLHAGVLAGPGGAVVVAGDREAGKSSLMAACALDGLDVLADDLAVVRSGQVAAGPRFLDLRPGTAERLPAEAGVHPARSNSRSRLALPAGVPSAPLVGVVLLDWADDVDAAVELVPVPVVDRLPALVPHTSFEDPASQGPGLLALVRTPVWRLTRPRRWDGQPAAVDLVRRLASALPLVRA